MMSNDTTIHLTKFQKNLIEVLLSKRELKKWGHRRCRKGNCYVSLPIVGKTKMKVFLSNLLNETKLSKRTYQLL